MGNCSPKPTKGMDAKFEEYRDAIQQIRDHPPVPQEALKNIEIFAERLRNRLDALDMTASDLAEEAGVTPQTIGSLLRGKRKSIDRDRLYLYAAILKCSPYYLLGLSDDFALYPPEEPGKPSGRNPAIWKTSSEQKILDALSRAAASDPVFVDYIFQIVENGKTENVKRLLLGAELVKERPPKTFSIFH